MTTDDHPPGNSHQIKPQTIVYVFNMSEDVWPFISAISDPTARAAEIEENANLADRDLFSLAPEDHVIFISPRPVSTDFTNYYQTLTHTRHLTLLVTQQHSGIICEDILKDEAILKSLTDAANSSRRLTLLSYATSPYFLALATTLRHRGLTIFTPEAPEAEDAWTVNFYGSKSGIRQLAQKSSAQEPDLRLADGLILYGITDAAKIAAWTYLEQKGVVLKTNKGHSGAGLLIFRPGDLPSDYDACAHTILTHLKKDAFWDLFPIIVEDYITPVPTIAGGFPNVEFKILKTGRVEFLYYCAMRISPQGIFKGVEISQDSISGQLATQMMDTGFFIGENYAAAGYRGYYDVDFIASKTGELLVTESNVRRTGGTHVYNTAIKLFGKDFMHTTFTLSNSNYLLPRTHTFTFTDILNRLEPILYQPRYQEGIIVTSENLLKQHHLAYIIFAKTKKRALDLESRMEQLLTTSSTPPRSHSQTPPMAEPPPKIAR